jgi:sugar lactone lactonase YvrE
MGNDASLCVVAVLGDALHRVAVLGGREGMPRSLGSVYGGSITRFLGGSLRGVESRVIDMPGVMSFSNGVAVSNDGSTLLVSDCDGGSHAIHEFSIADGSLRRVIGRMGSGPLTFFQPRQVYIAADDFVFVAEVGNNCVQVLTPSLDFHGFVGKGDIIYPAGVCANADVVVVSEAVAHRISVFDRHDGTLLRRFGSFGSGDGQLQYPGGLCFTPDDRHIVVPDGGNHRVVIFSTDGELVRHIPVGVMNVYSPQGVACSPAGDLLVVGGCGGVAWYTLRGELVKQFGRAHYLVGVALHGNSVVALGRSEMKCVVFT